MSKNDFILTIGQAAQQQMQKYNILASLILAQACLESNFGQSGLAQQGKNLFGVKGKGTAGSINMPTKEYVNGQWITVNAAFARYASWDDSLEAHSRLFLNGVSWDRNKYWSIIGERDYKEACRKVQQAGYATDPGYAEKLIQMIEEYKLFAWDRIVREQPKIAVDGVCNIKVGERYVPGVIINETSYVAVAEVMELLGHKVEWDPVNKTVIVRP